MPAPTAGLHTGSMLPIPRSTDGTPILEGVAAHRPRAGIVSAILSPAARVRHWLRPESVGGALAILLIAAIGAASWNRAQVEREQAAAAVIQANSNLALALEASVGEALGDVDKTLRLVEAEYRDDGQRAAHQLQSIWPINRELIRGLEMIGTDGRRVLTTGEGPIPEASIREHYDFHSRVESADLRIGAPQEVVPGTWRVPMSRRLKGPNGSLGGMLVAWVDPSYFMRFYDKADLGKNAVVSLITLDGIALVRQSGGVALYGLDRRGSTLFAEQSLRASGSYLSSGRLGVKRLTSYRTMVRYPLVVMVGSSEKEVFAAVRERARLYYGTALLASLIILAIAFGATRAVMRQRRDLVAVQNAEALLRKSEARMRAREAHLRATYDQALVGIAHADLRGRFIRANQHLCGMLGYTEEELVARRSVDITHPEDLEISEDLFDALGADPTLDFSSQRTKRFIRKDGSIMWALAALTLVRTDGGDPDYFLVMIQDITELKRIDQMKSEFVSTVSHELRTPLTSIRGSLGLLLGGVAGALQGKARELVVIAENNCERLIRLVTDILDIEKIEAGLMRFDIRDMDLGALLRRAVESGDGFARMHRVPLRLTLPDAPLIAAVDADRFTQVVMNLVSNAVKFSPAGVAVEVSLTAQRPGLARIEVRDHGPGIPLEFQSRMFKRFSQADSSSSSRRGGTGLGLNIAKAIVDELGGEIGFHTSPGAGTTLFVTLPAAAATQPLEVAAMCGD